MEKLPADLLGLIAHLKKLPGVGSKTAERFAFEWLSWSKEELADLSARLKEIQDLLPACPLCGCLTERGLCSFCHASTVRDSSRLCLIASPRDVFAIEATHTYQGLYHVVEHLLSPLDGRHAQQIRLDRIEARIVQQGVQELILAFDSTLEGDTTALYLKGRLARAELTISRLAFGIPVGSSFEYVDGGTLARALKGRQTF
jgi:recombination protein RecR